MITTIREHTFFRQALVASAYVLDLGANRGEFAREVARRFDVTCIAVEPSAELARKIGDIGVRVRRIAITDEHGDVALHVSENPEASSVVVGDEDAVRTEIVPGMPLEQLLGEEQIDSVALAKVDIEGAELGMFTRTPDHVLRRFAQFSVEFHAFTGALTEDDIRRISARLRQLGFEAIRFSAGHHNWLFFQPERCGVGTPEILLTRYLIRNARGVAVRAARGLSRPRRLRQLGADPTGN
jgi:FkbM family methyltransferase